MRFLLSVFIFLPFVLFAQITESFDDGNFTANPVWSGDVSFFEIVNPPVSGDGSLASSNDGQVLRSFPMAGDAVLLTSSTNSYGEWRFSIADGYNWAVSSTNDFKIILMTDNSTTADLLHGSQNFNGYYLKFDGATSDQFVLYRQSGTVSTPLIVTGYPTDVDGTSSIGRSIKVKRSAVGEWAVFIEDEFDVELQPNGVALLLTTATPPRSFSASLQILQTPVQHGWFISTTFTSDRKLKTP